MTRSPAVREDDAGSLVNWHVGDVRVDRKTWRSRGAGARSGFERNCENNAADEDDDVAAASTPGRRRKSPGPT
jgi:hypothetical protein